MKEKLTILTTTHFKASAHRIQASYIGNHDRYNTSTDLILETIENLYKYLDTNEIRHIISLDHDPKDHGSCEYLNNLNKLTINYPNIEIIVTTDGIRNSIMNLINSVETKYFLWFEHDWQFVRDCKFKYLLDLMDSESNINYIRFNKRDNIIMNCDSELLERKFNVNDVDIVLCGTSGWSNNPYLGRLDNWKDQWMTYLHEMPKKDQHVTIEVELQNLYRGDISKLGFEKALDKWGVYIYDKRGASKVVHHTNGKKR